MLNRVKQATGTYTRSTSRNSTGGSSRFEGTQLRGNYVLTQTDVSLTLQELQGKNRTVQLIDNDDRTRFLICSADGYVQILRSPQGVHVASAIDGEVHSFTGGSFVEIVSKNRAYFDNVLQPALKGLASLPVQEASNAKQPEGTPVTFEKRTESESVLVSRSVVDAIYPLAQFRLVDRQLSFNRVYGEKGLIDEELNRVQAEAQVLIDKSVEG